MHSRHTMYPTCWDNLIFITVKTEIRIQCLIWFISSVSHNVKEIHLLLLVLSIHSSVNVWKKITEMKLVAKLFLLNIPGWIFDRLIICDFSCACRMSYEHLILKQNWILNFFYIWSIYFAWPNTIKLDVSFRSNCP